MSWNNELISVRISRKSIAIYALFILVFSGIWFFMTGQIGPSILLFRLIPLLSLYQPMLWLYWGLTVNTVEGKFTYRRAFSKTEEFFRQDILEAKRAPVTTNSTAEEVLTIRTAKLSISLRCSDSGISWFPGSVSYSNVQALMQYLGV